MKIIILKHNGFYRKRALVEKVLKTIIVRQSEILFEWNF